MRTVRDALTDQAERPERTAESLQKFDRHDPNRRKVKGKIGKKADFSLARFLRVPIMRGWGSGFNDHAVTCKVKGKTGKKLKKDWHAFCPVQALRLATTLSIVRLIAAFTPIAERRAAAKLSNSP